MVTIHGFAVHSNKDAHKMLFQSILALAVSDFMQKCMKISRGI